MCKHVTQRADFESAMIVKKLMAKKLDYIKTLDLELHITDYLITVQEHIHHRSMKTSGNVRAITVIEFSSGKRNILILIHTR